MKKIFLLLLSFSILKVYAQNEFAATAFYNSFRKIQEDAKLGFAENKGVQRSSLYEDLVDEFSAKLILPLTDSGKIVLPVNGRSYVVYYFEPDKFRLKIDQRGLNLRDAILTAYGKPLYVSSETTTISNHPFTELLYYVEENEDRKSKALFRQCIYFQDGKYYLSLEIRGE